MGIRTQNNGAFIFFLCVDRTQLVHAYIELELGHRVECACIELMPFTCPYILMHTSVYTHIGPHIGTHIHIVSYIVPIISSVTHTMGTL